MYIGARSVCAHTVESLGRVRTGGDASRGMVAAAAMLSAALGVAGPASTPAGAGEQPRHHDIVIVSGQSNARELYAEGVMEGVLAGPPGEPGAALENASLFHRHHSGNRMSQWISGREGSYEYAENFTDDFWNEQGTSGLQQRIAEIEAAGETWSLEAFFWFQGEGDSGGPINRSVYAGRFMHMIRSIEAFYGMRDDLRVVVTLIDFNGDVEALAGAGGRTPEDIEAMRDVQRGIAEEDASIEYFDSRGWPRLDLWHVGQHGDPRGAYTPVRDLGRAEAEALLAAPTTAGRADLNGDGVLDLADIVRFIDWFPGGDPRADLATPLGVLDLEDVNAFADLLLGG